MCGRGEGVIKSGTWCLLANSHSEIAVGAGIYYFTREFHTYIKSVCVGGGGGGGLPPASVSPDEANPPNPSRVYYGHCLGAPLPAKRFALQCSAFSVNWCKIPILVG